MKYTECLEFIEEINQKKGISLGLDNIRRLCERLGNPQDDLKFVHIAGTNGKGSVLSYVSGILREASLKVGCYISPTLNDYRERFLVNGRMISQRSLCAYMEKLKSVYEDMEKAGETLPTAFEIETALAFMYFKDSNCDIVVLECGMGGESDATNIVKTTVLSVLTHISMDHMQFLGDTLEKIAAVKCGIIKNNIPVVSSIQDLAVRNIIENKCLEKNSDLSFADMDKVSAIHYGKNAQSFTYEGNTYETRLLGSFQVDNALTAIKAAECLRDKCGFASISQNAICKGLLKAVWPARFELVSSKPLILIDGAHNEDAALRLKESLDKIYPDKKRIYILGMLRDKECEKVASLLTADGEMVFTVATPNRARSLTALELADIVKKYNPGVTACDSIEDALEFATGIYENGYIIVATGSLSYMGQLLDIYGRNGKR